MTREPRAFFCLSLSGLLLLVGGRAAPGIPLGGQWLRDYEQAVHLAAKTKKEAVVVFTAPWHQASNMFVEETLASREVRDLLKDRLKVRVNLTRRKDLAQRLAIEQLPTVIFYDRQGRELDRLTGFADPGEFKRVFTQAHSGEDNFQALTERAAQNRDDHDLQAELLEQRLKRGQHQEGLAAIGELLKAAPEAELDWRSQLYFQKALFLKRAERHLEAIAVLKTFCRDFPLHDKVEDCYFAIAECYLQLDDLTGARQTLEAFMEARPKSARVKEARDLLEFTADGAP